MHFNVIQNGFRTAIALVVVAAMSAASAQAGSVIGTESFSVNSTTIDTSSITTATIFNFTGIATTNPSSGDFSTIIPTSGVSASTGIQSLTVPSTFTFGNAAFGTFTASSQVFDNVVGNTRVFELKGFFSGGTLFPGKNDMSAATLDITLSQVGGPGTAIGTSFTLATKAIPEPASVVMMGVGLVGALGLSRLRRKSA
jgi:hypothetical protein